MLETFFALFVAAGLAAAPVPVPVATVHAPPVVTVRAREFAFVSTRSVKAGPVTFRLVNEGKEMHHLAIVRLAKGKSMADYMNALKGGGPPPAWAVDVGGPNASTPNGGVSEGTVKLEPGNYLLVCWIPSPGNPAPHAMKGMVHPLKVTPGRSTATEAVADVDIRLSDYRFDLSRSLTPGKHLIRVTNDAEQSHELLLVQLPPGKTAADLVRWVDDGQKGGPPPGRPMGGAVPLSKGRSMTFPVDLVPGNYGLICFVPDAKDGKPHTAHGMVQDITVGVK